MNQGNRSKSPPRKSESDEDDPEYITENKKFARGNMNLDAKGMKGNLNRPASPGFSL